MSVQKIIAPRASTILYDLLLGMEDRRPFLLPANICPIVPLTFLKAGAPFEFVDISPETFHMDLEQVQALLARRKADYAGALYSHTYGDSTTPITLFRELKDQNQDFLLIDDRCLCMPDVETDPSNAADVILYSTGYAKIVDLGFGGYAFLRDSLTYNRHALPFEGRDLDRIEQDYKRSIESGSPYAYEDGDWLETDLEMPSWSEYSQRVRQALVNSLAQRAAINAVYDAVIPVGARLSPNYQLWRYNVLVKAKKETLAAIFAAGLFASGHYASLVSIFGTGTALNAAGLASRVINLFNDQHYSLEMAERTAHIVLGSL